MLYLKRRRAIERDSVLSQRLMSSKEVFEGVKAASATYVQNAETTQRLQRELEASRTADDKARVKQIGQQMTMVENNQRGAVRTHIMIPAAKKLADREKRSIAHLDGPDAGIQNSDLLEKVWREYRDISNWRNIFSVEEKRWNIPESSREAYSKNRIKIATTYLRASELDQPAPNGHFLREFGQSDREFIENASTDASITQALHLMNSDLISRILQPWSAFTLSRRNAPDPVEAIYMTLLTRKPTASERSRLTDVSTEDLVFGLVNGQQFLFVQ